MLRPHVVLTESGEGRTKPSSRRVQSAKRQFGKDIGAQRVFLFGRQRELALYRAEVLRDRGFRVVVPQNKYEAITAMAGCDFDVAVLSYTLSSDTLEELAELLRQNCPGCPLITISETGHVDRKIKPDEVVIAGDGPAALLKALRRVRRLN
jgi:hypothetical protein